MSLLVPCERGRREANNRSRLKVKYPPESLSARNLTLEDRLRKLMLLGSERIRRNPAPACSTPAIATAKPAMPGHANKGRPVGLCDIDDALDDRPVCSTPHAGTRSTRYGQSPSQRRVHRWGTTAGPCATPTSPPALNTPALSTPQHLLCVTKTGRRTPNTAARRTSTRLRVQTNHPRVHKHHQHRRPRNPDNMTSNGQRTDLKLRFTRRVSMSVVHDDTSPTASCWNGTRFVR